MNGLALEVLTFAGGIGTTMQLVSAFAKARQDLVFVSANASQGLLVKKQDRIQGIDEVLLRATRRCAVELIRPIDKEFGEIFARLLKAGEESSGQSALEAATTSFTKELQAHSLAPNMSAALQLMTWF